SLILGASGQAEPFDLLAGAKLKARLLASRFEPAGMMLERRLVSALRHQQHAVAIDVGKFRQVLLDFAEILGPIDDELHLVSILAYQTSNHFRHMAGALVPCVPPRVAGGLRRGVG